MEATVTHEKRYRSIRLAEVLKDQGRRRDWLAEKVGVSESFIGKVALGQRTISRAHAEQVSLALGIPLFFVFELHEGNENGSREKTDAN